MSTEIEMFSPVDQKDWRKWLRANHKKQDSIWLVMHKKKSATHNLTWSEAVDEALCFGWIDSTRRTLDEDRSIQFFSKRKPNSTWSKINKAKVEILVANGQMTKAGLACIEVAKQNGSWTIIDSVEDLIIPDDLGLALKSRKNAMDYFLSLSKSTKKIMLHWVAMARRDDTRHKRIKEIALHAAKKQKPKQF